MLSAMVEVSLVVSRRKRGAVTGAGMVYFAGGGKKDKGAAAYSGIKFNLERLKGGILVVSKSVRLGLSLSLFSRSAILTCTRDRGGLCRTVGQRSSLASCVIGAGCRKLSLVPSSALVDSVRCRLFAG